MRNNESNGHPPRTRSPVSASFRICPISTWGGCRSGYPAKHRRSGWTRSLNERKQSRSRGNGGRRWSKILSSPHLVFPSSSNTAPFPIVSNTAMIWDFLFTPMKSLPPGLNTVYISSWNRFFRSFPFSLPSARSLLSIIRVAEKKNNDYLHLRYRSFAFSLSLSFFFGSPLARSIIRAEGSSRDSKFSKYRGFQRCFNLQRDYRFPNREW